MMHTPSSTRSSMPVSRALGLSTLAGLTALVLSFACFPVTGEPGTGGKGDAGQDDVDAGDDDDVDAGPPPGCEDVSFQDQAVQAAFAKCTSCHSSTLVGFGPRQSAPAGVDFDVFASAVANAAQAKLRVTDEFAPMPPIAPDLTPDEEAALLEWFDCKTP